MLLWARIVIGVSRWPECRSGAWVPVLVGPGIVSENVPHCTLLYGLLWPGPELQKHGDAVLEGWKAEDVTIAPRRAARLGSAPDARAGHARAFPRWRARCSR